MLGDTKLVLLMAALHLIGLVFVALLLVMFLRSGTPARRPPPEDTDGGGGGGGNDRLSPRDLNRPPGDGLPLPDAAQSGVRLRDHSPPRDLLPRPARRRSVEPGPAPRRIPSDR